LSGGIDGICVADLSFSFLRSYILYGKEVIRPVYVNIWFVERLEYFAVWDFAL